MKFVTLDVQLNEPFKEAEDGTISSHCIGWFGVEGNPYSEKLSNGQWTGFVEAARIPFMAKTKDTDVLKEAALQASEQYRIENYPNT